MSVVPVSCDGTSASGRTSAGLVYVRGTLSFVATTSRQDKEEGRKSGGRLQ